jgi:hypothetical protein
MHVTKCHRMPSNSRNEGPKRVSMTWRATFACPYCLAAVRGRAARCDITLSAALAHCELSHMALEANPPRIG